MPMVSELAFINMKSGYTFRDTHQTGYSVSPFREFVALRGAGFSADVSFAGHGNLLSIIRTNLSRQRFEYLLKLTFPQNTTPFRVARL